LVLANENARVLGLLRALAPDRHDFACPPHGLVVTNGRVGAPLRLRQRADVAEVAHLIHPCADHDRMVQLGAGFNEISGQPRYRESLMRLPSSVREGTVNYEITAPVSSRTVMS